MGQCLPFSEIDLNKQIFLDSPACLLDSSFLVSFSDKDHVLFEDSSFFAEKLAEYKIRGFVSVTARTEFIDFHRRVTMTEKLMGILDPESKWKISTAVRLELAKHRSWLNAQLQHGNEPYFSDARIKECKQVFLPRTHSGHVGWMEFCQEILTGKLLETWRKISEDDLGLHYIDMRATDSQELFENGLNWASMYSLVEQTAMASNDAMILNLFNSSVIPALVTMDFDLAYGVMASSSDDKIVLVPDNLYRNRLKKLRF